MNGLPWNGLPWNGLSWNGLSCRGLSRKGVSRSAVTALLSLGIAVAAGGGGARAAGLAPFEAIRSLQKLQDRMASGDVVAQAAHARTIGDIAASFAEAKASTWGDKRNARALILYLFSGGIAPAIAAAIPPDALPQTYRTLYVGALAYGQGDDEAAKTNLSPIDARTLPSGLGGHLALLQATLAGTNDAAKAVALLDLARLLEPGTLVEEAALRKEMSLIGATGDLDKFALLTRRYLNAFGQSIYADNFRQLVAASATQLGGADTAEAATKLAKLTAGLETRERRRLYLGIAREAVVAGHLKMAAIASATAKGFAQGSEGDAARATLYLGAATIAGPRYEDGITALMAASPGRLDAEDRALRASALALADMIRAPAVPATTDTQAATTNVVAVEAERALGAADSALKEAAVFKDGTAETDVAADKGAANKEAAK